MGEVGSTVTLTVRKVDGDMLSTTLCRSLHAPEADVIRAMRDHTILQRHQSCAALLIENDSTNVFPRSLCLRVRIFAELSPGGFSAPTAHAAH